VDLSFFIAKRYLVSKKSNNAINVITWISITAITVTTAALIIILSAMNGLTGAVADLYNSLEPDLKISAVSGKYFKADDSLLNTIRAIEGVDIVSKTLTDKALLKNGEKQGLVTVKGVDTEFMRVTRFDSSIVEGENVLGRLKNSIILGRGIAGTMGVNLMVMGSEVSLLSPPRGKTGGLGAENFIQIFLTPHGIYSLNDEFDYQFVFVNLKTARELFDEPNKVSALEIKCNGNIQQVQQKLIAKFGEAFEIKNRLQLNDVLFKTLATEKLVTFAILAFILIIATFNIIGALTMLIIEKQKDIKTLFSMGADISLVRNIFMRQGFLITGVGALAGLVIGLFVCWLQLQFHLVTFGEGYIIPYYPIEIQWNDFVWIFGLIMCIGFFAALYPVRIFTRAVSAG